MNEQRVAREQAKQRLKSIKSIRHEIEALKTAKNVAAEDVSFGSKNITADKVQTSKVNTAENAMQRYVQLSFGIDYKIRELFAEEEKLLACISSIDDQDLRTLLENRYINDTPWSRVAAAMNYSCSYLMDLHRDALDIVAAYFDKRQ